MQPISPTPARFAPFVAAVVMACTPVSIEIGSVPRRLSLAGAGAGSGTVTSLPAGIDCAITMGAVGPTGCVADFVEGTAVSLTAAPSTGSTFDGWSGACSGGGACTATLDQHRGVTAAFGLPSSTNYALQYFANDFNDAGRVKFPLDMPHRPIDVGATDFTIEFWIRADPGDNTETVPGCSGVDWIEGNIFMDRDRFGPGPDYGISIGTRRIVAGVSHASADYAICGATIVDDGAWHHVALTRAIASGQMRLFVDGALESSAAGPAGDVSYPDGLVGSSQDPFLVLGAEKHDVGPQYPGFRGMLDELRFSTVLRYTGSFSRPTSRFVPDAATAALYHFDEGSGTVIGDASGGGSTGERRVGGNPSGPAWVVSTAPTGP